MDGSCEGDGPAAVSWISVLPVGFRSAPATSDDARFSVHRGRWEESAAGGRSRNPGDPVGDAFGSSDNTVAVTGCRPESATEARATARFGGSADKDCEPAP